MLECHTLEWHSCSDFLTRKCAAYVYIIVRADTALFISQFLTYSFGFPNDMIYCPDMACDDM